jgi:hypothetical protein
LLANNLDKIVNEYLLVKLREIDIDSVLLVVHHAAPGTHVPLRTADLAVVVASTVGASGPALQLQKHWRNPKVVAELVDIDDWDVVPAE